MLFCRPPCHLLVEGLKSLEDASEWKAAADKLQFFLPTLKSQDFNAIAIAEETIAYFLVRAALQADNQEDFDVRISEAVAWLLDANKHYSQSEDPDSAIAGLTCQAKNRYLLAWTSQTASSRTKLLQEAVSYLWGKIPEFASLKNVEAQQRVLGDLLLYTLEWSSTEPYSTTSAARLVSLLDLVDNALSSGLTSLPMEKARMLCLASQLARQASFWSRGNPAQTELGTRAVGYARQSQEANGSDRFLTGMIDALLGQSLADFESEPQLEENLWRSAQKTGLELRDRYITALSSSLLCYNLALKLAEAEEPEQAGKYAEECFRLGNEAVKYGSSIRFSHVVSSTQAGPLANSYYLLAMSEPDKAKRKLLRNKAVEAAREALETANAAGFLLDISNSFHSLSKTIEASCIEENNPRVKRRTLSEALALRKRSLDSFRRTVPTGTWTHGVQFHYLATLQSELASLGPKKPRVSLFYRALRASTTCLEYCSAEARGTEARERYGPHLAQYFESHARFLEQLHTETSKRIFLENALSAYRKASELYQERQLMNHRASVLWHCGILSHFLGAHDYSTQEFRESGQCYASLEREIPHLSEHFHQLASYLSAWSQVEEAHQAHSRGESDMAAEHYRSAATALERSDKDYLSINFQAWASLETADHLSRQEALEESSRVFQEASKLFQKSHRETSDRLAVIDNPEEREVTSNIIVYSESYDSYCRARALLDQARLKELAGDYVSASRLHDRTGKILESIVDTLPVDDRPDLIFFLHLSRGWGILCAARAAQDPAKYLRAATLFKQAAEKSPNARASQYAMGNRFLSEALASETKFTATGYQRLYRDAKRLLRNASICFGRANMDHSALAVDARLSLLDATMYATKAEASEDPTARTQGLSLAEKCLRHAAQCYERAADIGSQREVKAVLGRVRERKQLGRLLKEKLRHPIVASPSALISSPSHGPESAVGITEVEQRNVQGQLSIPQEVSDDKPFTVTLDLVNVGGAPVSLLQLKDFLPSPVKLVRVLSGHTIQDGSIDLTGRRLQPKGVESISVECLSVAGLIEFGPRVVYLNGLGRTKAHQVASTARHALSHATFEFESPSSGAIFRYLASEFSRDYMAKHIAVENSGWRSLPAIVKQVGVPMSAVYSPRGFGSPLAELVRRGLVDVRIFPSHPGRGGEVKRVRVFYEKNPVRAFVDNLAMKTSERPKPSA